MREMAAHTGAVICGSLMIAEHGKHYNRLIWMMPDGKVHWYDKRHLFTLAGEHRWYTAGQTRLLVTLKGWRILPLICYDLRFPVWSRNVDQYDLLIYVANWPERRRSAWQSLLQARAIENQAYTIGVNRVGEDENNIRYAGDSSVIDYQGTVLFQLAYQTGVQTLNLDYQEQQGFREKYAFLEDRDTFTIR